MKPAEAVYFYWQAHAKPTKRSSHVLDGVAFGYVYPNHKPLPYRGVAENERRQQRPILSITCKRLRGIDRHVFNRKGHVFDRKRRVSARKLLATPSKQERSSDGFEHNSTNHVFS